MSTPLMSVAVPAYNHAPYLHACLESVRAQTYPELELVLVDDGSTDDTLAIAEQFAREHPDRFRRIEIIRQENRGVSAASNRAIAACRGEWVHLLGSDDLLYPGKVGTQWQAIQAWDDPRLALVYADADFIDETGRVISSTLANRPAPGPDAQAYLWLVRANRIPNPTVALRREAFLAAGGFDEQLRLEDLECWLRLSARYSLARVPERLAAYRRHGGNASRRQLMMFEATWISLAKFAEQHGELVPPDVWRAAFRRRLRSFWRWVRKNARGSASAVVADALLSLVRTPDADKFRRYAQRCRALAGEATA